ncbi:hypothetical protein PHYBLDRAFT_158723 [Phycomyces blakesleeanus NRRL 1555(-)]|uniref:Uncharacterized protein n=1 Tax=Phycomyces blakesleeanus (strain ATCC 8743b / DSM 1359 / FGSC 10004 / NBRC 33097 / NRRL 1555) TaxID=763407 RepID=A0A162PVX4_PHYB8|nr:hypothetical protein PHYBLDRAFT_158723 [Phycomyces blakesleeanus NRRL 1555(-)]OAD74586.1 hypothetical protein PHYBLDRAFT_158723 [Phycomyces blakesleeanus NRRL 1555(-)]|eukprot:XP_018292626.1 hypothetical protein PHYBLDRAFT_158723 [Phycomyces blakesleeanus NRRL 1555(-)]
MTSILSSFISVTSTAVATSKCMRCTGLKFGHCCYRRKLEQVTRAYQNCCSQYMFGQGDQLISIL